MAATIGELKAALVNADKAGDTESARRLAAAIGHMQSSGLQLYAPPEKPLGIVDSVVDAVTGERRKTKTTETLPDWATMPELNSLSIASAKTGLGTLLSSPKETADIIKANYPDAQIRKDEKGNYVIKSSIDGREYAIKPGFQVSDIPRTLGAFAAFTPAGSARTIPGMAAASAATQATIEGTQAATGGEFNPAEVAVAGAVGGAVPIVVKAVQAARQPAQALLDKVTGKPTPSPVTPLVPPIPPVKPPIVTPPAAPVSPVPAMPAADLAQTAKTAAEGGLGAKGATRTLAEQAMPDPKTVEAAERLGIADYLQPDHVTTNQAFRELTQAVKSIPGSASRSAEIEGLNAVGKRADDLITEIGGSSDFSTLNINVKARLSATQQDLDKQANGLYKQLRENIPAKAEAPAPTVLAFINQRADELGGVGNLSSMEKTILNKLSPKEIKLPDIKISPSVEVKANFSNDSAAVTLLKDGKEIGVLDSFFYGKDTYQITNSKVSDSFKGQGYGKLLYEMLFQKAAADGKKIVSDYTVSNEANNVWKALQRQGYPVKQSENVIANKGNFGGWAAKDSSGQAVPVWEFSATKQTQPTYALLDDVRRDLTAAKYKRQGAFKDADTGLIKKLEMELKTDQRAAIEPYGMLDTFDAAQSAVRIRKGVEDDLVSLFGKTLDSSIVGDLSSAVKSLPSGDSQKLIRLLRLIPEDMRQEVMATGLNTAFGKQIQNGSLNFNTYTKWYEGLLKNKQAYTAVMSNLPTPARKQLSDLYRVAKGVSSATRERITTGRIQAVQDEIKGTDGLIENLYSLAKRSSLGVAAEAITTPLGVPGSGLAAGIASALTKGKPNSIKAVDALIASPEFTAAVKQYSTGETRQAALRLAYSKPFTKFVRAIGNPKELSNRERWILQTLEAQNQGNQGK